MSYLHADWKSDKNKWLVVTKSATEWWSSIEMDNFCAEVDLERMRKVAEDEAYDSHTQPRPKDCE